MQSQPPWSVKGPDGSGDILTVEAWVATSEIYRQADESVSTRRTELFEDILFFTSGDVASVTGL